MRNWKEDAQRLLDQQAEDARLKVVNAQRALDESSRLADELAARLRAEREDLFRDSQDMVVKLRLNELLAQLNEQILSNGGQIASNSKGSIPDQPTIVEKILSFRGLKREDVKEMHAVVRRGNPFTRRELRTGYDGEGATSDWYNFHYQREIRVVEGWEVVPKYTGPDLELAIDVEAGKAGGTSKLTLRDASSLDPFALGDELLNPGPDWQVNPKKHHWERDPRKRALEIQFPTQSFDPGVIRSIVDTSLVQVCSVWLVRLQGISLERQAAEGIKRGFEQRRGERYEIEIDIGGTYGNPLRPKRVIREGWSR